MADEHNKWLNRETAERLLSGESLEAVDASARDQAERLAEALGALSAETAPATTELPGEQAALAAFRKAREAAEAERAGTVLGAGGANRRPGVPASGLDADVVRIGAPTRTGIRSRRSRRPRWARPARLTLAAAVAAGTLGGVAMAAGSGVLPTPFRHERPAPGASVSADETPGQPLLSPSPRSSGDQGSTTATPGGGASGSPGGASSGEASGERQGADKGGKPGSGGHSETPGTWWREASASCRALRDGKELGNDRKRALEHLAGGSTRVRNYCKALLAAGGTTSSGGANGGEDNGGSGSGDTGGSDDDKGKGDGSGRGGDDEGREGPDHRHGHGHGRGHGHGHDQGNGNSNGNGRQRRSDVAPSPASTALASAHSDRGTNRPAPSPSPSYTAL